MNEREKEQSSGGVAKERFWLSESKRDPSETDSHVPDPKDRDHARRKHGINHHPSNGKDPVYQAYNDQEWRNGLQVQGGLEADD